MLGVTSEDIAGSPKNVASTAENKLGTAPKNTAGTSPRDTFGMPRRDRKLSELSCKLHI